MNTSNVSSEVTSVNNSCYNRHLSPGGECTNCRYALFPNTGRCTNFECAQYQRTGGAMTAEQLLREYEPPALFHGRHWGDWVLDTERLCLVFRAFPVDLGDGSGRTQGVPAYTAFWGKYEIDLERVRDSAAALDWVYQIRGKSWASSRVMRDLLEAFQCIFDPQANLCSGACAGGGGKIIKNAAEFLRKRIRDSGMRVAA